MSCCLWFYISFTSARIDSNRHILINTQANRCQIFIGCYTRVPVKKKNKNSHETGANAEKVKNRKFSHVCSRVCVTHCVCVCVFLSRSWVRGIIKFHSLCARYLVDFWKLLNCIELSIWYERHSLSQLIWIFDAYEIVYT